MSSEDEREWEILRNEANPQRLDEKPEIGEETHLYREKQLYPATKAVYCESPLCVPICNKSSIKSANNQYFLTL